MKKLKVYLAGPISKGDRGHNLAQFISWHEYLMTAGFAVFNPGLSMLLPWAADKSHSQWMEADIPFVLQSDLVVRLPGESVGADQEVAEAMKAGIPVYFAPEKPADKPRSLSLERFTKEAKALVGDGYVLADPSKPLANGTMYRILQDYGDRFSVSRAQAFGSGVRHGVAIAVKQPEASPVQARPEATATKVKKPEPKFKKGDRVQVHGASIAKYYTGPFPVTGTVGQVFPDTDCDVAIDGKGVYTFTEANLTLLPSYPAKVNAHGTDWHLATAADIGKPCYMMFPANNPPGALPKIEPSELGHIVKEVYVDGRVVSNCGSKAPAAYVPEKIPAKKEDIKPGDFVYITGKSIAGHEYRIGTIQKVGSVGVNRVYLEPSADSRKAGVIYASDNICKAAVPAGWRFLTENEKIQNGDKVSWHAEAEHLKDPKRLLCICAAYYGNHLSTPLNEKVVALRKVEVSAASSPVKKPVKVDDTSRHDATVPAWVKPGHRALGPDDIIQKGDLVNATISGCLDDSWTAAGPTVGMRVNATAKQLAYQRPVKNLKPQPEWVPGGYVALEPGSTYEGNGKVIMNAKANFGGRDKTEGGWIGSGWIGTGLKAGDKVPHISLYCARKVTKEDTDTVPEGPGQYPKKLVSSLDLPGKLDLSQCTVYAVPQPGQDHPTKGKAPDPESGFRLLHPDEPVKMGDEFKDSQKWMASVQWAGSGIQSEFLWYRRPSSPAVTEAVKQPTKASKPADVAVDAFGKAIEVGDTVKIRVDCSLGYSTGFVNKTMAVKVIDQWPGGGGLFVEGSPGPGMSGKAFRPNQVEVIKKAFKLPVNYVGPVNVGGRTMRLAVPGDEGKECWAGFPELTPGRSNDLLLKVESIGSDCKASMVSTDGKGTTVPQCPYAWVVDQSEPQPEPEPVKSAADTSPQATTGTAFKKFSSGAVRSSDADNTRFDLVSPIGLERLAMTCAEGAKKYGDHNWTKGMPVSECLNHCLRHVNMYLAGDKTEDHMAHAAWNLFAVMHFEKVKPDLVDVPTRKESK